MTDTIKDLEKHLESNNGLAKNEALTALKLINQLTTENKRLEYTLAGVMHFVDKWLDGEELEQNEENRAITMREKTLQIVENQQTEIERLQSEILMRSRNRITFADRIRFVNNTREKAIKDYKEKLKEHAYLDSGITGFQDMVVDLSDIENIADEMVDCMNWDVSKLDELRKEMLDKNKIETL